MKVLESAPERYDAGIRAMSGGAIDDVHERIAELALQQPGSGTRVLDIGSGTGGVALACARRGARVVGIDRNAGMLEIAREKAESSAVSDLVEFIQIGALEIEDRFESESFDAVVSCLVFSELLPEERAYVCATVATRLKQGGRFVLADEAVPRTAARRLWTRLRRLPSAIGTYLVTQTTTRPLAGLDALVATAGCGNVVEERHPNDAFAIAHGTRDGGSQ
jgi:demethylmenaquinone methyltransferase/2-methoxy-6-polyprenyl-1,4-benzoquinol methylase